jgi:hypothetical protein
MKRVVPALEEREVLQMAVRIHNRLNRFSESGALDRLMEIAEDNVITGNERPEFDEIMFDLKEIIKSGLELSVYSDCSEE